MEVKVIASVSGAGGPPNRNEDAFGETESSVWVLDGATGLGKTRLMPVSDRTSDAQWLARAFSEGLASDAASEGSIEEVFTRLIDDVRGTFMKQPRRCQPLPFELPSAGMAYVRVRGEQLEYARLGDCRAIVALPGGKVFSTGDSLLDDLDAAVLSVMTAIRKRDENGVFEHYDPLRKAVDALLRANRGLLNVAGGYWALGIDPQAVAHMEVGALPISGSSPVVGLLISDGFYRLVDTFKRFPNDAALLREVLRRRDLDGDLHGMLAELRAREDADPECVEAPRLKPKDDATAVLFEITAARQEKRGQP